MDENLEKMLTEEIMSQLTDLKDLDIGSNEKHIAVEDAVKLYGLLLETQKLENEKDRNAKQYEVETQKLENEKDRNANQYEVEIQKLENEKEYNKKQLAETKKDRYVKIGITAAEIIVAVLFNSFWMTKGFKFEETGSLTSGTFKEFRNNNKIIKFFKK